MDCDDADVPSQNRESVASDYRSLSHAGDATLSAELAARIGRSKSRSAEAAGKDIRDVKATLADSCFARPENGSLMDEYHAKLLKKHALAPKSRARPGARPKTKAAPRSDREAADSVAANSHRSLSGSARKSSHDRRGTKGAGRSATRSNRRDPRRKDSTIDEPRPIRSRHTDERRRRSSGVRDCEGRANRSASAPTRASHRKSAQNDQHPKEDSRRKKPRTTSSEAQKKKSVSTEGKDGSKAKRNSSRDDARVHKKKSKGRRASDNQTARKSKKSSSSSSSSARGRHKPHHRHRSRTRQIKLSLSRGPGDNKQALAQARAAWAAGAQMAAAAAWHRAGPSGPRPAHGPIPFPGEMRPPMPPWGVPPPMMVLPGMPCGMPPWSSIEEWSLPDPSVGGRMAPGPVPRRVPSKMEDLDAPTVVPANALQKSPDPNVDITFRSHTDYSDI